MLNLAEELLLLALEDESGRINRAASASLEFGLAGAVLMDLTLRGRLGTAGDRVVVADPSPTGDEVLDGALREIRSDGEPRDARHWVRVLGGRSPGDLVTDQLLARGVLRRQDDRVLWIFPYTRYLNRDAAPELELRVRLRDAVLDGRTPDARVAALLSLVKSCNLVDDVFGRAVRNRVRERLEEISEERLIGRAVSDTVAASQAALSASVIAATTSATASCTTTTSSSC